MMEKTLKDHVADLKSEGMRCNCDLDNGKPNPDTGHSWFCRIHVAAKMRRAGMIILEL
jgi:hypothetical protein